jgi:hypothetical protein
MDFKIAIGSLARALAKVARVNLSTLVRREKLRSTQEPVQ